MKIIIDISEKLYDKIMDDVTLTPEESSVITARIYSGLPLPKEHGRLIDADKLNPDSDYEDGIYYAVSIGQIDGTETIIEADKAEDDNK